MIERAAVNKKGEVKSNHEQWLESDKIPPSKGPKINPNPKAIPINAKFFGLSSGSETSLIAENKTDKLPPKKTWNQSRQK